MIDKNSTSHGPSSESVSSYYPTGAVTSTLPRSQSQWDDSFSREDKPFMPMVENRPRLTLNESSGSWRKPENQSSEPMRTTNEGVISFPLRSEDIVHATPSNNEQRPGMLTSDRSMHDLLKVLLRDTNDDDPAHLAPRLTTHKQLSTTRFRDIYSRNMRHGDQNQPHTYYCTDSATESLIWEDPFAPDLPKDLAPSNPSIVRGCLYPGAVFEGTQRNGKNHYQVTVEITNVDLCTSNLGGYLKIRGLTQEWPELTTYFDAEIIGERHSFITNKWDATRADDIKHWSRFPEFNRIRDQLKDLEKPFDPMSQPVIFMRWKEQFLVPDHRVRSINGASFAGFYYMCVVLEDGDSDEVATDWHSRHARTLSEDAQSTTPQDDSSCGQAVRTNSNSLFSTSVSSTRRRRGQMRGFYFHENSEPYQELLLDHTFTRTSGNLELR
ncbi:hypothetical protein MPSI1_001161 [Malassezia psittaci]|uniref:Uncharacterized protein n=1 Tax=Malassezia psittaci TaxID=1821823 RepID=A0AAF0F3Y3_9BASI|nr:hypothetical protein MPSI1_001161 [Malassezia psittaci]